MGGDSAETPVFFATVNSGASVIGGIGSPNGVDAVEIRLSGLSRRGIGSLDTGQTGYRRVPSSGGLTPPFDSVTRISFRTGSMHLPRVPYGGAACTRCAHRQSGKNPSSCPSCSTGCTCNRGVRDHLPARVSPNLEPRLKRPRAVSKLCLVA